MVLLTVHVKEYDEIWDHLEEASLDHSHLVLACAPYVREKRVEEVRL